MQRQLQQRSSYMRMRGCGLIEQRGSGRMAPAGLKAEAVNLSGALKRRAKKQAPGADGGAPPPQKRARRILKGGKKAR